MNEAATDEQLRAAWVAAVSQRGRTDPVVQRVAQMSQEWPQMQGEDRDAHRLVALRMLQEIGPG